MKNRKLHNMTVVVALLALASSSAAGPLAQTKVKPGFNVFSLEQDIEMGREASKEVEQKMPMLDDPTTVNYISSLGKSLAAKTDKPDLPWQFKVVNAEDVNAFALPGGFIYVNRGLIESARSEAELTGVLSHEISHVTLRHGTNQVSKAMMVQVPLSVLGGTIGSGGWKGALAQVGISAGLSLALSKFSRTDETQADILGAQLMTNAGYDPRQLAGMFQTLKSLQKSEPGKLEQWFASHPDPADRVERINKEIASLKVQQNAIVNTAKFSEVQARIKRMPAAPKPIKQTAADTAVKAKPPLPSTKFRTYRHPKGGYSISYPDNWRVSEEGETGALFSPEGGIVDINGQPDIKYGTMINVFDPDKSGAGATKLTLRVAADQLVQGLQRGNPYLKQTVAPKTTKVAGAEAVAFELAGTTAQGSQESVSLIARWHKERVLYLLFISPTADLPTYQDVFRRITRTLVVSK